MNAITIDQNATSLKLGSRMEHHLSLDSDDDVDVPDLNAVTPAGARVLHQFIFGGCQHCASKAGAGTTPTTWLQGDACQRGEMLSAQCLAVSDVEPQPVFLDGQSLGYVYEDEDARYCYLGSILPADVTLSREAQTLSVFERIEQALATCGMEVIHIARTWLYLENLLEWYGPFNDLRTDWFRRKGVFDHLVPASTGIGASNASGAALTVGLFAVQPLNAHVTVEAVKSPLQCSAEDYASSFSRAVEVRSRELRTLYISGTASIEAGGRSMHTDDAAKQIERTMEVVEGILTSRGMSWHDAVRGIAYFKDIRSARPLFDAYCQLNNIPAFPLAVSHADVCRDDLLFEIEIDAAVSSSTPFPEQQPALQACAV